MTRTKKIIIALSAVAIVVLIFVIKNKLGGPEYSYARVQNGIFETTIETVGELFATSSQDIELPQLARNEMINARQFKIIDIIQEGSIVKQGDWVVSLDPTETEENRRVAQDNLDKYFNNLENARLDSNMLLTEARMDIVRAKDDLDDKILKVEQSSFESKAIQRQAVIEKETAERKLERTKRSYEQKKRKYTVQIRRYEDNVRRLEKERDLYSELIKLLYVRAPSNGMVVYSKGWDGNKIKTGSTVSLWDPKLLSLPDLSTLMSETYIREVDFAKVAVGQKVRIKIDAFPGKEFAGEIKEIANVGQTIPGEQQIGFKTLIKVEPGKDLILPSMTTSNAIILKSWPDALIIPRKALFREDNRNIVYRKTILGIEKVEVQIEQENEQQIMIKPGDINVNNKILTELPKE
jgi:multidrug efflux pump subunit AcrA (membrane-fusion protein)